MALSGNSVMLAAEDAYTSPGGRGQGYELEKVPERSPGWHGLATMTTWSWD